LEEFIILYQKHILILDGKYLLYFFRRWALSFFYAMVRYRDWTRTSWHCYWAATVPDCKHNNSDLVFHKLTAQHCSLFEKIGLKMFLLEADEFKTNFAIDRHKGNFGSNPVIRCARFD
jgi:hypothetical protein